MALAVRIVGIGLPALGAARYFCEGDVAVPYREQTRVVDLDGANRPVGVLQADAPAGIPGQALSRRFLPQRTVPVVACNQADLRSDKLTADDNRKD